MILAHLLGLTGTWIRDIRREWANEVRLCPRNSLLIRISTAAVVVAVLGAIDSFRLTEDRMT